MTVLMCLLSDQHIPNLLAAHHFKPDKLVLIETLGMAKKSASTNLLNALRCGGLDYAKHCHIETLEQEDNLGAIRRCLHKAYAVFPSDDWIANITGGTKPMSIAAYEFFNALGSRLIYVNAAAPNRFIALDGKSEEICSYRPSIKEFLLGYGFDSLKPDKDIQDSEIRAEHWWECARAIAASNQGRNLLKFDSHDRMTRARQKGLELEAQQFPVIPEFSAFAKDCFGLTIAEENYRGYLDKRAVCFLTGEWLEIFIWRLLRQHSGALKIWDVRLGLHPGKKIPQIESDFDVAFMHEYSLSMVECKSGDQEHDRGVDALHKIEAVVRQFRALRVQSYLATTSENVLGGDGEVRKAIADRASIYGCRILTKKSIQNLAIDPENTDLIRKTFFGSARSV